MLHHAESAVYTRYVGDSVDGVVGEARAAQVVSDNPIVNSPYQVPNRYWKFDENGITDVLLEGRRPSESWVPVPRARKGAGKQPSDQLAIDLHRTDDRRERNDQVDQIRRYVGLWRQRGYPHTTSTSRRLLQFWSDPERDNPILFAQREAIETAIYLAEAAAKDKQDWIAEQLHSTNATYNHGLPRVALKMATGSGKTVVMAMLIAWQTLNHVARRDDKRYSRRFLVVAPGITIRDRLRVLSPSDAGNYFAERDLVPADLWPALRRAEVTVTNFHSFLQRTTHEARGIASDTKALATARIREKGGADPFTETPAMMVARVLRGLSHSRARDGGPLVVLNDEAHHCYAQATEQVTSMTPGAVSEVDLAAALKGEEKKDADERNRDAGVWFSGLREVAKLRRVGAVYDLSATPFFLAGSGYREGLIFPWVVSDFGLVDAIEAGIVKIPRVPVTDDAEGDAVTYLNLWDSVGGELPKRVTKGASMADRELPTALEGAIRSLYASYERAFARWERQLEDDSLRAGSTPPVYIVVCPNTLVSRWVYDKIAGSDVTYEDGVVVPTGGMLDLFSNVERGKWLAKPRTILVDSAQLESDSALSKDFRDAAATEITAFREEYATRTGRAADDLSDGDLLREVLNTVGKPGRLGEGIRCVISVSMLSEGWDANTVTHVLGVRAFGSQLLCEQVVGRGLRRRSYVANEQGFFEPEYAEVYGVPFSVIPSDRPVKDPVPGRVPVEVRALVERHDARITFPRLDGYRLEIPDQRLYWDFSDAPHYPVRRDRIPTQTQVAGLIGEADAHDLGDVRAVRLRTVAYRLAKRLLVRLSENTVGERQWLFPQLVRAAEEWITQCVVLEAETFYGMLTVGSELDAAAQRLYDALNDQTGGAEPVVMPVYSVEGRVGSTDVVDFRTTKRVIATDPAKCHVDGVVLDGVDGNTWEQIAAQTLEVLPDVAAYVKNDHLELAIPYVYRGRQHRYLPDFVVRLTPDDDGTVPHLLVEISGGQKDQDVRAVKAATTRGLWCPAVNRTREFGRWSYVEIFDPVETRPRLLKAIADARVGITGEDPQRVLGGLFDDDDEEHTGASAAAR